MPDEDNQTPEETAPAPEPAGPEEGTEGSFDAVQAAAELAAALAREPAEAEAPSAGGDNYTAILEDEVETLKTMLAEKEQALEAAQKKAATAAAEVDRVRTRIERDAKATIERGRRKVLISFLDVADDLDRAVAELDKHDVAPALAQGIGAVRDELRNAFKQHGVQRRPSLGETFDSAIHDAIGTAPATEQTPDGTIAAVLQEGYVLGEETLRAARVVVAKG